jgi:class 3 adenylate cyclase
MGAGRPEIATLLFTDVVGSTAIRMKLGDAEADELRRRHDDVLRSIVEQTGGRWVKGLGDGIMAVFTAASDAVDAAVRIQLALRQLPWPVSVVERIGLAVGEPSWEGEDCFGSAVVEAARLCAAAEGEQILVSDMVRALAQGRCGHGFRSLAPLELKGFGEAVRTSEVEWVRADEPRLPPALTLSHDLRFVGRHDDMDVLRRAWTETLQGYRHVVLVAGEPGIGKYVFDKDFSGVIWPMVSGRGVGRGG